MAPDTATTPTLGVLGDILRELGRLAIVPGPGAESALRAAIARQVLLVAQGGGQWQMMLPLGSPMSKSIERWLRSEGLNYCRLPPDGVILITWHEPHSDERSLGARAAKMAEGWDSVPETEVWAYLDWYLRESASARLKMATLTGRQKIPDDVKNRLRDSGIMVSDYGLGTHCFRWT